MNVLVAGNGSYIVRPCGHDLHGPTISKVIADNLHCNVFHSVMCVIAGNLHCNVFHSVMCVQQPSAV